MAGGDGGTALSPSMLLNVAQCECIAPTRPTSARRCCELTVVMCVCVCVCVCVAAAWVKLLPKQSTFFSRADA
jgi:hypothetical protein